jgi:hypothetical protein
MTCDGHGFLSLCQGLVNYVRTADVAKLRTALGLKVAVTR